MSYLNYDGLAYFKSKFTNWVDQNYLSKTTTGNTTIAGNVTFTKPITGDVDGKVKKDWLGQKIDETYIKEIATNDNAGTIVYTKGNGSTNHILIDLLRGATPIANGKAGLVPAPTVSEMNYFLRGDGNWAVPTDVYVNQNLIASSNNNQFPVLLSGTSGTPATKTNATVGYTNVVSVNPLTNALMASQFISKHPTYNRQNAVSSKIQYSLNFTDIVSGAGHNLGEVVGYVDTVANGGEHELGLRLFGNPNVQGTEEDYVYMGVGLSKTNVAYGHAPSTPLPSAHNEPTDIITRDWLARNGSETGLVHTTMNETIDGAKTFKKTVTINSGDNNNKAGLYVQGNSDVHGNEHVYGTETVDGKLTTNGTAEIKGGSGNTPSLTVTGSEYVSGNSNIHGNMDVDGNSNTDGNQTVGGTSTITGKLTANGTAEIKGGSGSNPSLLVTGNETVTGKLTGTGTAEFSGGSGNTPTLTVNGNESVSGNSSVGGNSSITGNETVGGNISTTNGNISTTNGTVSGKTGVIGSGGLTVNGNETITGEIYKTVNNTPQEYVSYVTNKTETKNIIVNNLIKENGGLAQDNNHNIYVEIVDGGGIKYHVATAEEPYNGLVVDFSGTSEIAQNVADQMKADLLSSLGLQVPLTADKNVYVNPLHPNSSDVWHKLDANNHETAAIDTSAGSTSKPFKTIATAIRFATEGFSLGNKSINIRIQAYAPTANITAYNNLTSDEKEALGYSINNNHEISYYESLTLPTYNVTSGVIRFYSFGNTINSTSSYTVAWSKDATDTKFYKAIIDTKDSTSRVCMNIQGKYTLYGLHLRNNINYRFSTVTSQFPGTLSVNSGGIAYVYGCTIESKYLYGREHANSAEGNSVAYVELRPVSANEGSIYFRAWDEGIPNEFHYDRGPDTYPNPDTADTEHPTVSSKVNLTGIMIWANSLVDFPSSNTDSPALYMIAEGSCTRFISCSGTGRATGGGLYDQSFRRWEGVDTALQYNLPNDATNNATSYHLMHGQKYSVVSGGILSSPRGGFPGDSRGSVNTETYSVYTGSTSDYNWNSSSLDTVIGD